MTGGSQLDFLSEVRNGSQVQFVSSDQIQLQPPRSDVNPRIWPNLPSTLVHQLKPAAKPEEVATLVLCKFLFPWIGDVIGVNQYVGIQKIRSVHTNPLVASAAPLRETGTARNCARVLHARATHVPKMRSPRPAVPDTLAPTRSASYPFRLQSGGSPSPTRPRESVTFMHTA